jgi:tetraacyldisaccharide 4'-kinase
VIAFAGIGRPEKFFDTLRALDVELAEAREFADHHMFSADEIAQLKAKAKAKDKSAMLVTTEKDFMRLAPAEREGIDVLRIEAEFESPEMIEALLNKVTPPTGQSA